MNKKIIILIILFLTTFFIFFNIIKVQAATYGSGSINITIKEPEGNQPKDIGSLVKLIFDTVITISEIAFIVLFLVGGVMYMTSAGNEEQSKKARTLLIEAVVGLVIVLSAWAVSNWIIDKLKNPNTSGGNTNQNVPGKDSLPDPAIITNEPPIYDQRPV